MQEHVGTFAVVNGNPAGMERVRETSAFAEEIRKDVMAHKDRGQEKAAFKELYMLSIYVKGKLAREYLPDPDSRFPVRECKFEDEGEPSGDLQTMRIAGVKVLKVLEVLGVVHCDLEFLKNLIWTGPSKTKSGWCQCPWHCFGGEDPRLVAIDFGLAQLRSEIPDGETIRIGDASNHERSMPKIEQDEFDYCFFNDEK